MFKTFSWLMLIIFYIFLWPTTVYAHKVKLFATAAGDVISGYAYFPGGGRITNMPIQVQTTDGHLLGTILTNTQGEFTYTVTQKSAHTFLLDTGDGHQASYTVKAEELSDNLPTPPNHSKLLTPKSIAATSPVPVNSTTVETAISPQELEKLLDKAIRPLREQLETYQEKIYLHDILGGIGYIFGIMGLIFYWGTHQKNR